MQEQEKKKVMPIWVGIICITLAVCATTFTVLAAAEKYNITLPVVGEFFMKQSDLQIVDFKPNYNLDTMRFSNFTFTIQNNDSVEHYGEIYVKIYGIGNVLIAEGSIATGVSNPNSLLGNIVVQMTWVSNYTVSDTVRGDYQLQQVS